MKVFVYRNLHNGLWSIRAEAGEHKGKVIGYASGLLLLQAQFKVSESGRERVREKQRKEVHAGVSGLLSSVTGWQPRVEGLNVLQTSCRTDMRAADPVYYNPYRVPEFVRADDHDEACTAADLVWMGINGYEREGIKSHVWAWGIESYSLEATKQLELFAA